MQDGRTTPRASSPGSPSPSQCTWAAPATSGTSAASLGSMPGSVASSSTSLPFWKLKVSSLFSRNQFYLVTCPVLSPPVLPCPEVSPFISHPVLPCPEVGPVLSPPVLMCPEMGPVLSSPVLLCPEMGPSLESCPIPPVLLCPEMGPLPSCPVLSPPVLPCPERGPSPHVLSYPPLSSRVLRLCLSYPPLSSHVLRWVLPSCVTGAPVKCCGRAAPIPRFIPCLSRTSALSSPTSPVSVLCSHPLSYWKTSLLCPHPVCQALSLRSSLPPLSRCECIFFFLYFFPCAKS